MDRIERIEYVVVSNSNASLTVPARFEVLSADTEFELIRGEFAGGTSSTVATSGREFFVEVPPLTTLVFRATSPLAVPASPPEVDIVRPDDGIVVPTPRYRIEAEVTDDRYAEVTFAVSVDGATPMVIGVDDAAPYRVYWDNSEIPTGAVVEVIATVDDRSGTPVSAIVSVTMGDRS